MKEIEFPFVIHNKKELERLYERILYERKAQEVLNYMSERNMYADIGFDRTFSEKEIMCLGEAYCEAIDVFCDRELALCSAIDKFQEKEICNGN